MPYLAMAALLSLALLLCGCSSSTEGADESVYHRSDPLAINDKGASDGDAVEGDSQVSDEPPVLIPEVVDTVSTGDPSEVVARVGERELTRGEIDHLVSEQRSVRGYESDEAWQTYLGDIGATEESLWRDLLDQKVRRAFIIQSAAAQGISISDDELETALQNLKDSYGAQGWAKALIQAGITEGSYRGIYYAYLMEGRLKDALFPLESYEGDPSAQASARTADFDSWVAENLPGSVEYLV